MASRGMGAMSPKKMTGKKMITRTDDPNKVAMYKKGGKVMKMAEGDLVKDVKVKPTSATSNEDYTGFGAKISGNIPLSEKEKLALNADITAGKSRGQGVRGSIDRVTAEYKRQLDKNTDLGASISRGSSGEKRYGVSYNKRFAEGGEVWDQPRPKNLGAPQKLSPAKKASAKASAKRAGRPYPNLVDNMRAAKTK